MVREGVSAKFAPHDIGPHGSNDAAAKHREARVCERETGLRITW